jgi:hypothetical protein
MGDRRRRIHELVLALLAAQGDIELLDADGGGRGPGGACLANPAGWLERNRRVMQRYQALVRSAVTLDALVDQEVESGLQTAAGGEASRL